MDWNCQPRDIIRAATHPNLLRAARLAALMLGIGALVVPSAHAQQYGPNFYHPQQTSLPANMPRQFGNMPPGQNAMIPQQYPRIYGPLTPSAQSTPMIPESAPPRTPPMELPSTPMFEAPAPAPYLPIPNHSAPAPSWPAKRSAQPAMETQSPAPSPDVPFHRPTNKDTGWITADYLISVSRSLRPSTPLVTTSLPNVARSGALGQAETSALYGAESIDFGIISGVRLNVGCFLGSDNRYSVEADGFWRGSSTPSFFATSDARGYPILARPIFNIADNANREAAFLTSFPALFAGNTQIQTRSQLAGFELNGRYHAYWWERVHADALVGFRYLNLTERIQFNDQLRPLVDKQLTFRGAFVNAPNTISDEDVFGTNNQFFGGQIGARASWETGRFSLDGFAKLALGITQQHVTIDGSTTLITPTGNQTAQGGILAQKSNIGTYNRSVFTVVPEFGVNLGVDLTEQVRLRLGYSLLLWDRVARPTGQIDHNVNSGQVPSSPNFGQTTGPNSPVFQSHDEFFWNHFFNVGMELRY